MENQKLYFTINEIMERYNVSRTTVWRLSKLDGCPPFLKLCGGGKTLIEAAAFDAFFREQLKPAVLTQNRERQKEKDAQASMRAV